jgi:hypothetical protein
MIKNRIQLLEQTEEDTKERKRKKKGLRIKKRPA